MVTQVAFSRAKEIGFPMINRGDFFFWDDELSIKLGICKFLCLRENRIYTVTKFEEMVNSRFCKAVLIKIENECRKLN